MKKLLFILFLLLSSCTDFIDTWDAYIIDKGEHYSHRAGLPRRLVSLTDGRHMRFDAYFTNSCLYEVMDDDVHKLYGFTDANSLVHDNSARFGWRHNGNGRIEIFAYWYADGVRGIYKLGETDPYTQDRYEIWARDGQYNFSFNNLQFITKRDHSMEKGIRVRLFPYFGGNRPAPHSIKIFIREHS